MNLPKIGQFLWSSCAGESYGEIVDVGIDPNNVPTIAIKLKHASDIAWTEDEDENFPYPDLSFVDLPKDITIILRDVQYVLKDWDDSLQVIICRTPGNGCFRCTKLFRLTNKEGNSFS